MGEGGWKVGGRGGGGFFEQLRVERNGGGGVEGRGKGGWRGVTMFSIDNLDRDTGDVESQSHDTNDEYFYDEVTGTFERWVLMVGVEGGEVGVCRGSGGGGNGSHGLHREGLDRDTGDINSQSRGTSDEYFYDEVTDTLAGWVLMMGGEGGEVGGM